LGFSRSLRKTGCQGGHTEWHQVGSASYCQAAPIFCHRLSHLLLREHLHCQDPTEVTWLKGLGLPLLSSLPPLRACMYSGMTGTDATTLQVKSNSVACILYLLSYYFFIIGNMTLIFRVCDNENVPFKKN